MTWDDYDGERIKLVQIKTGRKLSLPCPPELRAELDAWKAQITTVGLDGNPQGEILRAASGDPWEGGSPRSFTSTCPQSPPSLPVATCMACGSCGGNAGSGGV